MKMSVLKTDSDTVADRCIWVIVTVAFILASFLIGSKIARTCMQSESED